MEGGDGGIIHSVSDLRRRCAVKSVCTFGDFIMLR